VLLQELVDVSAEVAATGSRLAKRDLIAGLLARVPAEEVEVATAYLSGRLVQRRTGVGWRSLTDLPPPATEPTVEIVQVDRVLAALETVAGPGSTSRRRALLGDLWARLTASEQEHLSALLTGNLRQGAQDAVVLEAIAAAADVPMGAVRRAAMFSALTGPIARAALTGGVAALERFDLEAGRPVRPMLAASAPDVAAGVDKVAGAFAVDTKLDGIRIQVHKRGDDVRIFTRSLDEIAERLPGVVAAVRSLPAGDLVLDGEAMTLDEHGRPRPFQETASSTAARDSTEEIRPFFFDLLLHDDEPLVKAPLSARLERLDALVPEPMRVRRLLDPSPGEAAAFFTAAVAEGQEGVVLKRLDSPYDAGRRGSAWVKVKPRHTLDLVVLAVEWGSGRRQGWLSNIWLGARDGDGGFVMLGKTFKGMTDAMLQWQTERFLALETSHEGHVVHVRPEQVVEIAFDGLQRSRRYPGGLALRFARVVRYRDDKSAEEADTIETVRELAAP
jgi:DNA ligase-1